MRLILAFLLCCSLTTPALAAPAPRPAGWIEKVLLEPGAIPLKAKLDTGAKTSSLHALNIESFKRDGERWIRFTLEVEDTTGKKHSEVLERRRVRGVRIKEHEGEYDRRPVVQMSFCLDGQRHSAEFTLADRSRFIYPVLLGREFLAGNVLVDASETFTTKATCPSAAEDTVNS